MPSHMTKPLSSGGLLDQTGNSATTPGAGKYYATIARVQEPEFEELGRTIFPFFSRVQR